MLLDSKTKNIAVYEALRNDIVNSKLKHGQKIILSSVAKRFKLRIYRAAPYPYLHKFIRDLLGKADRTQSVFAYVPARAVESIAKHSMIIEALRAKSRYSRRYSERRGLTSWNGRDRIGKYCYNRHLRPTMENLLTGNGLA